MSALVRTFLGAAFAANFLLIGVVQAQQAQEESDIVAATRDLRRTLGDLDKRLARLEKLVKQQTEEHKKRHSQAIAPLAATRADPAADLIAGQDAYRRGRLEENGQQFEKAVELYTLAVRFDPGNDLAFLHRAISSMRIGRLDEALADVNHSLAIQPNNAQAYAFRGKVHLATKAYDHASEDLKEASLRDSGSADYLVAQADIEGERGNFQSAAAIYDRASKLQPDSPEIHIKRAVALRQMNEASLAAEQCSVAITLKPMGADGYSCRAESYMRLGFLPKALSDLNQAVHLEPTLPKVTSLLAVVHEMINVDEALAKLTTIETSLANKASTAPNPPPGATTPAPAVPPPPSPAAPVSVETAKVDAPKIVVVQTPVAPAQTGRPPDPAGAQQLLREGRKEIDKGLLQPALIPLGRAIELDPSLATAYNTRGYVYLRTRQYDLAIRDFSKAIGLNSGYANAYWNRAAARRLSGDTQGSKSDFMRAAQFGYAKNGAPSER